MYSEVEIPEIELKITWVDRPSQQRRENKPI